MSQWDDSQDPWNTPYNGDGGSPQAPPSAPAAGQKRYNTTPSWLDPYHAPTPNDPYYAEWAAANPGIPESAAPPVGGQVDVYGNPYGQNAPPQGSPDAPPPTPGPGPTTSPNPYDSGGLVPKDGTYPGGPPPVYGGGGALNLPQYRTPPEYQFERFKPTTAADMLTDPGYQVRFDRGIDAVRADKAASGVYNGGGTARALLDYGQDSASQEFKNVDDRRLTDFNVNEGNRFKSYLSNVSTQYDTPYANAYKSAVDTGNFNQGDAQFGQNSQYNDWLSSYNAWRNSRNDAFQQKFQVSSF